MTAADVPNREGGKQVRQMVQQVGDTVRRVHTIWVDGGYDSAPFYQWAIDVLRWVIWVVLRPDASQRFVLLKSDGKLNELSVDGIAIGV